MRPGFRNAQRGAKAISLVGAVIASLPAIAQQSIEERDVSEVGEARELQKGASFAITAGGAWSDNVARAPQDEESGSVARAGVILGYEHSSAKLDVSIDGNVSYEHYIDDTFDDGVIGGVSASLVGHLVPDRLRWTVEENFGQVARDPFFAATPETRENINVFSTGPDLRIGGGRTYLALSARYTMSDYEMSLFDSNQYDAVVSLVRDGSKGSSLSLNVAGARVDVEEGSDGFDYDRYESFIRLQAESARTVLHLDAGYTMLEIGNESPGGVLLRGSINRRLSQSSSVFISLGSQYSNSAEMFRMGQVTRGVTLETSSVLTTSEPFENRFASVEYNFFRGRTRFGLSVHYSDEDYEESDATDRTVAAATIYISRQLRPLLELRVFANYEQERYDEVDVDTDEIEAGAYLDWQVGRRMDLRLQYDWMDRKSTLKASEFTENRVSLSLSWWPARSL